MCRFFRDACYPRSFYSLHIKGTQKKHVDFCDAIRKSPQLVNNTLLSHVQHLYLSDWTPEEENKMWAAQGLLKVYSSVLPMFDKVQSLYLINTPFDSTMLDALYRMVNLHEVTFIQCKCISDTGRRGVQAVVPNPRTSWTRFTYIENGSELRLGGEFLASILVALHASPALVSLVTTDVLFAPLISRARIMRGLKEFCIPYDHRRRPHFENLEKVESISIPMVADISTHTLPEGEVHSAVRLPTLKTLQGPWWLIKSLITLCPGIDAVDISASRPTSRATMNWDQDMTACPEQLQALVRSVPGIHSLSIGIGALALSKSDGSPGSALSALTHLENLRVYDCWDGDIGVSHHPITTILSLWDSLFYEVETNCTTS